MEESTGQRIRKIRKDFGLTQPVFAQSIGISQGHLSEIESDKSIPTEPILLSIEYRYSIKTTWIITGEGPQKLERKEAMSGHESDPKLASLMDKLVHIYKEGTLKERAEVRGIIEEVYDEIGKTKK